MITLQHDGIRGSFWYIQSGSCGPVAADLARDPSRSLELIFRIAPDCEVIQFRYVLHCARPRVLTNNQLTGGLRYYSVSFSSLTAVTEVRLSEFNELSHSYTEVERKIQAAGFPDGLRPVGPILVGSDADGNTLLLAYEHGSTVPDAFVRYRLSADRALALDAVKGNYVSGQEVREYETIWMDAAVIRGDLESAAG